jgi:DNA repair exonuclease SbcCD nuclease subunit
MTVVFSDLHLEAKSADVALECLRRVAVVAEQHGDDHIVCNGDFHMARHLLPARLLLDARDIVIGWRKHGIKRADFVVGNHDFVDTSGRNALELFDGLESFVHVHTQPTWTDYGFMLPYRHTNDEIRRALEGAAADSPSSPPTLFGHMGVLGAQMNSLQRDETGFPAEELLSFGFKRVVLGHYHRHGPVMKGVTYVGSPYQVSYAEAGQPKGVCRLHNNVLTHTPWRIGPQHHKVVFDADNPTPLAMPIVEPGDKLWVVVKGQMARTAQAAVQEALKSAGIEPARIDVDYQPEERAARIEVRAEESKAQTALRFVETQDVDPALRAQLTETFNRVVASGPIAR